MTQGQEKAAMNKYFVIAIAVLIASLPQVASAEDDLLSSQLCNGRSNQGKLLLGSELVMRTGLCEDYDENKGLLLTEDALKRLGYDAKNNSNLLHQITSAQYAEIYRAAVLNAVSGMINSGYAIDNIARASGEEPPLAKDASGNSIISTDTQKSNAQDCKLDQDAARCYSTATSEVKAISTQALLDLMTIRSSISRDKTLEIVMEKVVKDMDVDLTDEQLKYPKGYEPKEGEK